MWAKLIGYFERGTNSYKKKRYLEQLSEFEHPNVTLEHLPTMLVEFWRTFDINTMKQVSPREWMYITLTLKHSNVAELIYAVQDITNAIAQDAYGVIQGIAKERFITAERIDLDGYWSGTNGEILDPIEMLQNIKDNIHRHGEIIENIENKAYARFLFRFYKDVLTLTECLVNNIKV